VNEGKGATAWVFVLILAMQMYCGATYSADDGHAAIEHALIGSLARGMLDAHEHACAPLITTTASRAASKDPAACAGEAAKARRDIEAYCRDGDVPAAACAHVLGFNASPTQERCVEVSEDAWAPLVYGHLVSCRLAGCGNDESTLSCRPLQIWRGATVDANGITTIAGMVTTFVALPEHWRPQLPSRFSSELAVPSVSDLQLQQ
jgi:hypothetical protein